jgi:quercetin dioxygenase-like cupin family protein
MRKLSLEALAREHLDKAFKAPSGRSSTTVYGGHEHVMRQTLIAITAGKVLNEHESPGEATVYVLAGRVRLVAGADSWEGREGDFLIVPPNRHSLEAIGDAVVLLSVGAHDSHGE